MHPNGEAGAARAAGLAGTGYILSTISGHRVEDVKAASSGPVCFQLYLMGGREASEAVIERARVAGCAALVVTIDTPVAGMRERDFRNGMKELMAHLRLPSSPNSGASRMAGQLPARRRPLQAAERGDPRQGTNGAD
jgi:L-lactate dehydrogenase (cytochrome)